MTKTKIDSLNKKKIRNKIILFAIVFCALLLPDLVTAHPGIGIVMDSQGTVYYTDLTHVWKITPDGSRSIAVKNVHTHELYLDSDDNLYGEHVWYEGEATDKWGYYVWRLNKNGELEKTIPETEGFPVNNTLIRDCEGNEYWQEKSGKYEVLKKKSAKGDVTLHTTHKFKDIRWIYVMPEEMDLLVIDHLTLKKVTSDGHVFILSDNLKERSSPFASVRDHHYLMGVWTDTMQNIYIAVFGAGKIKKITPKRTMTTVFESPKKWSPSGGLTDPEGNLWVLEFSSRNKTRVRKIGSDGQVQIFED